MSGLHRLIGLGYRWIEGLMRPLLYRREKAGVLSRFPNLAPVMNAFEARYIRAEYGAHDQSLMERRQRQLTEQEAYVYGSTPWLTFLDIADSLSIDSRDVFIEPGCGTGHLCFLMNQAFGVQAIGIEAIGTFVEGARAIQAQLRAAGLALEGLHFEQGDFLARDFREGTIFFIAGTCFPEGLRRQLSDKIAAEAPAGATVIALTHAIEDKAFRLSHQVEGLFSWGRDKALIYKLTNPRPSAKKKSRQQAAAADQTAGHSKKARKGRKRTAR